MAVDKVRKERASCICPWGENVFGSGEAVDDLGADCVPSFGYWHSGPVSREVAGLLTRAGGLFPGNGAGTRLLEARYSGTGHKG